MGYEAYQTLLLRQQNQLLHDQTNLMRASAGLPPLAPLHRSGASTKRTTLTTSQRTNRDGTIVLVVMAVVLLGLLALCGWGVVALVGAMLG